MFKKILLSLIYKSNNYFISIQLLIYICDIFSLFTHCAQNEYNFFDQKKGKKRKEKKKKVMISQ